MTALAIRHRGARPAAARRSSTFGRVFEHRWLQYRRTFRASIFSSFLSPVMFLTAMGLGLGSYVSDSAIDDIGGVSYLVFLAPGLLAATAMQAASFEATFPIMGGLVWTRIFHAMYATPISPRDIALGNLLWIAARLTLISTVFTAVIVLFGAASSPLDRPGHPGGRPDRASPSPPRSPRSPPPRRRRNGSRPSSGSGSRRCSCSRARSSRSSSLPEAVQAAGLDHPALPRVRADPRPVARDAARRSACSR